MSGIKKKIVFLPYDFDTALGIDNYGRLRFSYEIEDIDTVDGEKAYAGQDSVLWKNVRAAFADELAAMYKNLRSGNIPPLSYDKIKTMFETHQDKWPEALFNEDSWYKYILPLIEDNENRLEMCLGSKEEQRKWWLYNRFKYIDSKYNAGDASADSVSMRSYYQPTSGETYGITITPYADIYATVLYGVAKSSVRAARNTGILVPCTLDHMEFTDTYIYSASQIKSFGDLSIFRPDAVEFSRATHMQELKLGDSDSNYSNPNLKALTLGNNILLKKLDCRNCINMGSSTQKTVDVSNCTNIEEVYFDGTVIQGLTLPDGGFLKKLHLPGTMTNITILNQKNITLFVCPSYNNITTLRLENNGSAIDTEAMLSSIPAATRLRLIGFRWEADDATEIENLLDLLDTMRGLDEQGNTINIDAGGCRTSISGTIHTAALSGAQIANYNSKYPYILFTADHVSSILTYKSYDGETTLKTVTCLDGVPQEAAPAIPARANSSDGHYSYAALGWNRDMDAYTNDPSAITNITADRTVYAAYTRTVRTYTVTWVNNGTTIETDTNVLWGTVPHYDGATPTKDGQTSTGWLPDPTQPITGNTTFTSQYLPVYTVTFKNDTGSTTLDTQRVVQGGTATYGGTTPESSEDPTLAFLGWATSANSHTANATLTNVQASMTVYAAFESSVEVVEITDSWDTIIANIDNGTYSTRYKIGNYKPLDLGTEGTINMQIVAMDADELASGGTAPLTFLGMELSQLYPAGNFKSALESLYPLVANRVVTTTQKESKANGITDVQRTYFSPSLGNLFAEGSGRPQGETGVLYTNETIEARCKYNGEYSMYITSSYAGASQIRVVTSVGKPSAINLSQMSGVPRRIGFCLGLEPETIEDSWETILANENYATDYSIGDTKMLDLGTEGKHLMEIVAFDTDDRADGQGKAGITWISKDLLNSNHRMNLTQKTVDGETAWTAGGWENSDLRAWLKETVKLLIPATVRNAIVPVTKVSSTYTGGALVKDGQTTTDDVWIPGHREIHNKISYETTGAVYSNKFNSSTNRIKKRNGLATGWWLRSIDVAGNFRYVNDYGSDSASNARFTYGVALGFCTN